MPCMVASSIPCKLSLCADRAHACAGDSHASSGIDVACPTTQSVLAIASPHELHGDSWPSSSTGTSSFCCNHQYSITAVTTSAGAIAERYAYSAYGQPTISDASASVLSSSAINNRYTYTGREWDATLGLHHFRARWLSPIAGRFLRRDPIGYRGGINTYGFLLRTNLRSTDPSGLHDYCFASPGCSETNAKGNCGADLTDAFSQYLSFITPWLKSLPSHEVGYWDGLWWMWSNGGNIDFWVRGGQPKCCATKGCANSVMLCGNCMRDTVANNILYGFVAAAHGIASGDASLGANINNIGRGAGFEGCEQQHAYQLGYRLWDHYSDSSAQLNQINMCDIINGSSSDPFGWFPLINCIKAPYTGCGNCGKSFTLGQIGRKGIGNTNLPPLPSE